MRRIGFFLLTLCFCQAVLAQEPARGFPPYATFSQGQFDSVNMENLNVVFSIPIASSGVRGLRSAFVIRYNSAVWYRVTGGSYYWTPATHFGWETIPGVPSISYDGATVVCEYSEETTTRYFNFRMSELDGTVRYFDGEFYDSDAGCSWPTGGTEGYALDGSGYYLVSDGTAENTIVYSPSGSAITQTILRVRDTNGNYVERTGLCYFCSWPLDGWAAIVDPVGRETVKVVGYPTYMEYQIRDSTGTLQTYTLNFQSFNIKTNFGCAQSVEYSSQNVKLPVSLVLPNGRSYTFTYEDTPSWPGWITARLKKVTLPTGGYYEYVYPTTGNKGMTCGLYGQTDITSLTRNINDGTSIHTWQYSRSLLEDLYYPTPHWYRRTWKTTVTPPQLPYDSAPNQSTYTFKRYGWDERPPGLNGEVVERHYQGVESSNQLLRTVKTLKSYGGFDGFGLRPLSVTVTLDTNQQSKTEFDWNNDNQLLEKREYDWASGAPGSLLRKTTNTFLNTTPYADRKIRDRVTQTIVRDGGGSIVSRTDVAYDTTALTCITGAVRHDDTNYGCSFTYRGNPTSITRYSNASAGTGALTETRLYDSLGNLRSVTDPALRTSSFDYTDNFTDGTHNSFGHVTQVTYPTTNGIAHLERSQYFWFTGLPAASCGQNFPAASPCTNTYSPPQPDYAKFTYDAVGRPLTATRGDGAQTTLAYNEGSLPLSITTTTKIDATQNLVSSVVLDSLGRTKQTQLTSDPQGTVNADITNDAYGRTRTSSNPYRSTGETTYGITTFEYDALGRTRKVIPPDGTSGSNNITMTYSGNSVTATDQAGKKRKTETDGLGRMFRVWEPDAAGTFTYETLYQYNTLDNLVRVDQKGGTTDTTKWRTRTFAHDSLGRVTSATNPESNTTQFFYTTVAGALCAGDPTAVCRQTDARNITITYSYDELNRPSQQIHSDSTPAATFTYDLGSLDGLTVQNPVGRLVKAANSNARTYNSYDIMGRVVTQWQCTPANCGTGYTTWFSATYLYNELDQIKSQSNPAGFTLTHTFNPAGRLTQLTSSWNDAQHPGTLLSPDASQGYHAHGALKLATLGNGLAESATYNNRLQPTELRTYDPGPSTDKLRLTYGFVDANGKNNGNVMSWSATGAQSFSRTFTYDELSRLKTMTGTGGACTGLEWTYDIWGNRTNQNKTSGTCGEHHPTILPNNRIAELGYDAAGNVTSDTGTSYQWDAENRMTYSSGTLGTATVLYDAVGRRIRKTVGTTTTDYFYDLGGNVVAERQGTTWVRGYVYLGGHLLAQYSDSTTYFFHKDHLGSTRVLTRVDKSVHQTYDYMPFGEGPPAGPNLFTGLERDGESGLDHTWFRKYTASYGRWQSTDPLDGDVSNPQTFNLYSYVANNPLNFTDPLGLECTIDGILDLDCSTTKTILGNNWGVRCPNDDCSGVSYDGNNIRWRVPKGVRYEERFETTCSLSTDVCTDSYSRKEIITYSIITMEVPILEAGIPNQRSLILRLTKEAEKLYPKLKGLIHEHHLTPKYFGGPSNGPTARISAAYHQLITNAFRTLAPYGQAIRPTARALKDILRQVYSNFPLP
jgi:RHS repeat-associated protein